MPAFERSSDSEDNGPRARLGGGAAWPGGKGGPGLPGGDAPQMFSDVMGALPPELARERSEEGQHAQEGGKGKGKANDPAMKLSMLRLMGGGAVDSQKRAEVREKLVQLYRVHRPKQMHLIDVFLDRKVGQEEDVLLMVERSIKADLEAKVLEVKQMQVMRERMLAAMPRGPVRPDATAVTAPPQFQVGGRAVYIKVKKEPRVVTITSVKPEPPPPSYVVRFGDGEERETEGCYLKECDDETPAVGPQLPGQMSKPPVKDKKGPYDGWSLQRVEAVVEIAQERLAAAEKAGEKEAADDARKKLSSLLSALKKKGGGVYAAGDQLEMKRGNGEWHAVTVIEVLEGKGYMVRLPKEKRHIMFSQAPQWLRRPGEQKPAAKKEDEEDWIKSAMRVRGEQDGAPPKAREAGKEKGAGAEGMVERPKDRGKQEKWQDVMAERPEDRGKQEKWEDVMAERPEDRGKQEKWEDVMAERPKDRGKQEKWGDVTAERPKHRGKQEKGGAEEVTAERPKDGDKPEKEAVAKGRAERQKDGDKHEKKAEGRSERARAGRDGDGGRHRHNDREGGRQRRRDDSSDSRRGRRERGSSAGSGARRGGRARRREPSPKGKRREPSRGRLARKRRGSPSSSPASGGARRRRRPALERTADGNILL